MDTNAKQKGTKSRFRFFDLLSIVLAISALTIWSLKSGVEKKESRLEKAKGSSVKRERKVHNLGAKSEAAASKDAIIPQENSRQESLSPTKNRVDRHKQASIGDVMRPLAHQFSFSDIEFFESAGTDLTEAGRSALQNFAAEAGDRDSIEVVEISTFTDDRPVTPHKHRFRTNAELAALRAIAIQTYLEENGFKNVPMKLLSGTDRRTGTAELKAKLQTENELASQRSAAITLVRKSRLGDGTSPIAASRSPKTAN